MHVVLVYLKPFRRNSLLKCALQPKIAKNSTKPQNPLLGVQDRSVSPTSTNLKSPSPVFVIICSESVPIYYRFHTIRANSGKIASFKGGYPSLTPSFERNPFTQGHEILSLKTSHLGSSKWRFRDPSLHRFSTDHEWQTDGRTDR